MASFVIISIVILKLLVKLGAIKWTFVLNLEDFSGVVPEVNKNGPDIKVIVRCGPCIIAAY